ncbi:hypothetical protein [Sorangium sp. So ce233]|uniref:hypothetical protein n=1 Tax=Sorangium sp. So ce233 TaxID=3133290 RepID=UPI003F5F730A
METNANHLPEFLPRDSPRRLKHETSLTQERYRDTPEDGLKSQDLPEGTSDAGRESSITFILIEDDIACSGCPPAVVGVSRLVFVVLNGRHVA